MASRLVRQRNLLAHERAQCVSTSIAMPCAPLTGRCRIGSSEWVFPLFHANCTYSRGCQSNAIDATRKRRRRHFAASLQTVPLLSWLRSQLNLISSGLIPTLNRIRPEEAMQREIEGAISMTKTITLPGNPPAHQTLNTPINSIVAGAKTAHELESARRKATRDKAIQRLPL